MPVKISELFSSYEEVHAFVHGLYAGFVEWRGIDSETMRNEDVKKEPHYAKAGYIVGTLLRVAIIVLLARTLC